MNKRISTSSLVLISIMVAIQISSCSVKATEQAVNADQSTVPAEYVGKRNKLKGDDAIQAGGKIYKTNCITCHGENGEGDGVLASSLNPSPKPIAGQALSDDYIFWRISEGGLGRPFQSAMPSWKSILSEEQVWEVILYLRSLGN